MTITLPLPIDIELSEMPYFPVRHARLLKSKSWRRAKARPEIGFFMMNTWIAVFLAVGLSLEDDDDELAEAAMCHPRDWLAVKSEVLRGWVAIDGRWYHPVVAEIAFDLWLARLKKRYENASDSWRAQCKRATDKGHEPPDPPGHYEEWLSAKFPATAAYLRAASEREGAVSDRQVGSVRPTDGESPSNFDPKRSKAKQITPLTPQGAAGGRGRERGDAANGKAETRSEGRIWFATTLGGIERGLGPGLTNLMLSYLPRKPGTGAKIALVDRFKNCEFSGGAPGQSLTIKFPSRARAHALMAEGAEWLPTLPVKVIITWKGAAHG